MSTNQNPAGGGTEQNKPTTPEPLTVEKVTDLINATVTGAITRAGKDAEAKRSKDREARDLARKAEADARDTALVDKIMGHVKETVGSFEKSLNDRLKNLQKPAEGGGDQNGGAGAQPDLTKVIEEHPAVVALRKAHEESALTLADTQKKLGAAEKAARAEKEKREQAEQQARGESLLSKAAEALTKKNLTPRGGVMADRLRVALNHLIVAEHRIAYSDDGKGEDIVFWKGDGKDREEVTLTEGLKWWAATDEAKIFLPPVDPGGSGGSPSRQRPRTSSQKPEDRLRASIVEGLAGGVLERR